MKTAKKSALTCGDPNLQNVLEQIKVMLSAQNLVTVY